MGITEPSRKCCSKESRRVGWLNVLAIALLFPVSRGVVAADVLVGQPVAESSRVAMENIDHEIWGELLGKYVDGRGLVAYGKWHDSPEDMRALDDYIKHLSTATIQGGVKEVQLAFWINAYNAITIQGILREYPTTSIRNHTAKLWGYNIWKNLKLQVDGRRFALEDIEHKILRKLGEPRIHFAIVCASIGCPRLRDEAYVAERLDEQLTANAVAFFADPAKFQFDSEKKQLRLSPILSWFSEDFGDSQDAVLKSIARYVPQSAQSALRSSGVTLRYLNYDWGLNDQGNK